MTSGSSTTSSLSWLPVTSKSRCPICGHNTWCSFSSDGAYAVCRRLDTGNGHAKTDKSGSEYWVYRLDGRPSLNQDAIEVPATIGTKCADADTLDRVYSYVLDTLPLSTIHREQLHKRGLSDVDINLRGYSTMPVGNRKHVVDALIKEDFINELTEVPGFRLINKNSGVFTGAPGLLIPVRNENNKVVALKIRRDKIGDGPKYLYISSTKHGGPGPGSPVHVPLCSTPTETIRLTEGELKADITTSLSGMLTIGLPGVSIWHPVLPILRSLAVKTVRLAFDADARQKLNVARALEIVATSLEKEGFTLEMEVWDA
ncbi:DUF3854 domain-containing protein [Chloroflexota bacterium]